MTDMEARNILHRKISDAVGWLDLEIENLTDCSPDYFRAAQIGRLEELRDDLAETLTRTQEVQ